MFLASSKSRFFFLNIKFSVYFEQYFLQTSHFNFHVEPKKHPIKVVRKKSPKRKKRQI